MPPRRIARVALALSPALVLAAAAAWFLLRPAAHSAGGTVAAPAGRLVVVLVFDQMRGDFVDRWSPAFGPDGFEAVKARGVWYSNCHLPFACSSTAPGHASIATGAPPSVHGIVENAWLVPGHEKLTYCVYGTRPYPRVPPGGSDSVEAGLAPEHLLAPTVGDALRAATGGKARVFSVALKDRAAVLLGGKDPSGAYCFDSADGRFHTSTYYRDRLPGWAERFNAGLPAEQWGSRAWERVGTRELYDRLAGPDDAPGEGTRPDGSDRPFPHPLPSPNENASAYFRALEKTPFANDLLWAFAKEAVTGENLGRGDAPDLLFVGFSANDTIGHAYGPDSHETLDCTVRSDRIVADAVRFLDEQVGAGQYTLIVTADHGVCPLPESANAPKGAGRVPLQVIVSGLDEALDEVFGRADGAPGQWVEPHTSKLFPWVYLNRRHVAARGIPFAEVERYAEQWLGNRPSVRAAFGRGTLERGTFRTGDEDLGRSARRAYHPDRCGDILVVTDLYVLIGWGNAGTNHGGPHPYDTHVPVMAVGAGVPQLGRRDGRVSSLFVAPFVARLLGVPPPSGAAEAVPEELK